MDKNLRLMFFLMLTAAVFCQTESPYLRLFFVVSAVILAPVAFYPGVSNTKRPLWFLALIGMLICVPPALAKESKLRASITEPNILKAGKDNRFILKLTDSDGKPVTLDQLQEAHTRKIHLLVVDQSLMDYHHLHPTATDSSGSYVASFTPNKDDSYKVWADVTPVGGKQQFIPVSLVGAKPCGKSCVNKIVSAHEEANGLKATLSFESAPKAGGAVMGKITLTDVGGKPVTDLEPVMGAFAHIAGFYEDFATVAHVHPMGKEPANDQERGGPDLSFHLEPAKAGFLKLYVQVRRNGQEIFIPLGVMVH